MTVMDHVDDSAAESEHLPAFRLRTDVRFSEREDAKTGGKRFYVKVSGSGDVFEFGAEEYFLLRRLDGVTSYDAVMKAFNASFGFAIAERQFAEFLRELARAGLIERIGVGPTERPAPSETASVGSNRREAGRQRRTNRESDPPPETNKPYRWRLFNPDRLFRGLAWLFYPVRYLLWMLVPALMMAGLILFHRQAMFAEDLALFRNLVAAVPHFLFSLFFVNLFSRLAQGSVARGFGAPMHDFGIRLGFGIIPRFYVDKSTIRQLSRRGQLWAYAAPLLMRLSLFAMGTFLWIGFRQSGTWLPVFMLLVGQMGLMSFLFTANPLWPADGYRWISIYLGRPNLRRRALRLLGLKLKGEDVPQRVGKGSIWPLLLFAAGTVIYTGILVVSILFYVGVSLEGRFQGTGVVMFLVVFGLVLMWLLTVKFGRRRARDEESEPQPMRELQGEIIPARPGAGRRGRGSRALVRRADAVIAAEPFPVSVPGDFPGMPVATAPSNRRRKMVMAVLVIVLMVAAFLPYPYEIGGNFKILPAARIEVRARVDGEILEVQAREGQWMEAEQVLAVLSDWNERKDIAIVEAKLDKAEARLRILTEGPKPEAVESARKSVETAEVTVRFARKEAERARLLLKSQTISRKGADEAFGNLAEAEAALEQVRADLALVESDARPGEIEAAGAEIRELRRELEYRKAELERTSIRAPAAGRIITPNLHHKLGSYLPVGGLLAELEDNRIVQAEIEVPEAEIGDVKIGAPVRLKAWGYSESTIEGLVTDIAPVANMQQYGLAVRVISDIPNPDGALKSQMTGYAKIQGPEMRAWEAFTRMLRRFFLIEFWSWIP
jgi:multidrug resistance efflux pump